MKVQRVGAREGYDLWAESYDQTPNPVVSMDARHTIALLAPRAGERILDAGCGTGRNFAPLLRAGCALVGVDFSLGMLRVARDRFPAVPLAQADLQQALPLRAAQFDAILCALIGEHLDDLHAVGRNFHRLLRAGGRLVFSVYHPAMAEAGKEANFQQGEVEYRLGAERHSVSAYRAAIAASGLVIASQHELKGDAELAAAVPSKAARLLDFPVLLVLVAHKPS